MSDRTRQSVNDSAGKSRQTVQSYQPVWMAHWMRTSSNATAERSNPSACRNKELDRLSRDDNLTNGSEASSSIKELGVIENDRCGKPVDYKGGLQFYSKIPVDNGTTFRGFHSTGEGTSKNPLELMRTHSSAREAILVAPNPSTHVVPYYGLEKYEVDKGKAAARPVMGRSFIVPSKNQLPNANLRILEQDSHSESDASMKGHFRECNNTHLLLDDPSTSRDWFQKIPKTSGITLTEPKKLHYNCYSLQKLPNSANDLKTTRICTTEDSSEAMCGGFSGFSQTTHSLLITKKTDVHGFLGEGNRGVKLRSLSSSSNSEGKRNIGDFEASKVSIKNESSAETDTMDMDIFKENPNSGANSNPSTKGFNMNSNLSPSSRGIKHNGMKTKLPDMNLELPALPAIPCSSEKTCPSSSRTQSLEIDALFSHAEQSNPKQSPFLEGASKEDPTKRWVKRLKLNSSNSSIQGTKSSNLGENLSHDKMRKIYRGVPENEHKESNDKELLLSHSWIKRWLRNESNVVAQKKTQNVVVCEPQISKLAIDDLQKKQFPSIAAMALMGKAVGSFPSCKMQKSGPFTVWKAF